MASSSNLENDLKADNVIDRISSLPDEILVHIISALPTKYAVATSVLSSRWRYLFPLITSLDFDDSLLLTPPHYDHDDRREHYLYDDERGWYLSSFFKSSVERMLRLCISSNINRFSLKCHQDRPIYESTEINSVLSYVVDRKVKELNILLKSPVFCSTCILNPRLFTCETLEVLKLDVNCSLEVPLSFCLPSLKIVHLRLVEFPDSNSVTRFFSGCPALEEFITQECRWKNVDVISIHAAPLKRLYLELTPSGISRGAVVLNCPNLLHLSYLDSVAEHYSMVNLHALVRAKIYVSYSFGFRRHSLVGLWTGLSSITRLSVCYPSMEVLGFDALEQSKLPVFHSLKELSISVGYTRVKWEAMVSKLLDNTPALEHLIFRVFVLGGGEGSAMNGRMLVDLGQSTLRAMGVAPSCLSSTLKTIQVKQFTGLKEQVESIKYFLKNAKVLEEVKIHCVHGPFATAKKELFATARTELLEFPMCSETCSITFTEEHMA